MAPTFRHGRNVRPLIDEKDLSPFLTSVTVSAEQAPPEVTTFQDSWRNYIPGLRDVTFACEGLFAASTTSVDDVANYLDGALGGSTRMVVTIDAEGTTGGRCWMLTGDAVTYDVSAPVDGVVSVSLDVQGSHGYTGGRMLKPLSTAASGAYTGSGVATPGTTSAGGTTGGMVIHAHKTVSASTKDVTVTVQHSTSGSTWATYTTVTLTSGASFARSTVSGTVKERVRITTSSTTPAATFAVAYSRRART